MFIETFNNNGKKYLRLVNSKRIVKGDKVTCLKEVIKNIGPYDRFDDGKENYLERLKTSFKNGNPIIPELREYVNKKPIREHYDINIQEGDPDCFGKIKLYSNAILERILEEIGVINFIARYKQETKIEYDLAGFIRLLIYGRILNPASKINTLTQRNDYYNDVLSSNYDYNVYDTLDFVEENRHKMINWINNRMIKQFNRTTNYIFYDVTNFFFETEDADEQPDDEEKKETADNLRQFGVSKENRKQPIVQMGLFMDDQGIPISIETFPGNTLDHQTLSKGLKKTIDNLNLERFIFVGDRGMYRGNNTYILLEQGNGYIISKSIDKTAKNEKNWIYNQDDYVTLNTEFKYKSKIVKRKVKIGEDLKEISEKVVVYFSKKFYDKQIHENEKFLKFLDELEKNPNGFRMTKTQSSSIRRFLKSDVENQKTGEIFNSNDIKQYIDFEKIKEYKKTFGYYQIVTSEIKMPDLEVIAKYHGLSQIEDQFRTMKSTLETRPIYVRTRSHINAHLTLCLISLIIIRIIQNKIVKKTGIPKDKNWSEGLSPNRIQKALNKFTVTEISNGLYRFNDLDNPDLKLILDSFDIKIPCKLFRKNELRSLKTTIKICD